MKKSMLWIAFLGLSAGTLFAQGTSTNPSKMSSKKEAVSKPASGVKPAGEVQSTIPGSATATPGKEKGAVKQGTVLKKDGTPDKRFKASKKLKKDGTPDKRFKENKPAPSSGKK